mmetsp:Transcript_3837/g.6788  ORF Transcript_3837/g.6788 Transcript_3837/m.6788 type:complete len:492 (-) Transcript_3837:378-1853(-)
MGEEGAEVALHDVTNLPFLAAASSEDKNSTTTSCYASDASTSSGSFRAFRTSSLLDGEKTPMRTPPHSRQPVTPSTCELMGGCHESGHAFVEKTITTFLEDSSVAPGPFPACTDWQAWSYFGFNGHSDVQAAKSPSKENIRSVLRHRASQSLRTRKSAVRNIRKNLAPFGNTDSPARSPARAPSLFRNRSFSVSDHRSAIVRGSKDIKPMKSSFTDVLQLCTMPENTTLDSPEFIKLKPSTSNFHGDDVCYDSDPEDFTRRRRPVLSRSFSDNDGHCTQSDYPVISYSPSQALMDVNNDVVFQTIVQEVFNKTCTLVLHPLSERPRASASGAIPPGRPVAIDAWLERGQNLTDHLLQPKWMWKPQNIRNVSPQSIELLDITRILKVEDSDRSNLPFAKPSHCFLVKSIHHEEFCFEAPNSMERDRLVYSLKLVIARFGTKVLVGDPQVYYEFFSNMEAGVPGEAPDLYGVQGYSNGDYDDEDVDGGKELVW